MRNAQFVMKILRNIIGDSAYKKYPSPQELYDALRKSQYERSRPIKRESIT